MKKQLPTNTITNELSGASLFFQPAPPLPSPPGEAMPQEAPDNHSPTPLMTQTPLPEKEQTDTVAFDKSGQPPVSYETSQSEHHATTVSRHHDTKNTIEHTSLPDTKSANHPPVEPPRNHDTVIPAFIETVRKAVKQIGKEAATHRYTPEEKQVIAEIVYTYARRGCKTSENEISRIAINWLVQDYQHRGTASILDQVLKALNE